MCGGCSSDVRCNDEGEGRGCVEALGVSTAISHPIMSFIFGIYIIFIVTCEVMMLLHPQGGVVTLTHPSCSHKVMLSSQQKAQCALVFAAVEVRSHRGTLLDPPRIPLTTVGPTTCHNSVLGTTLVTPLALWNVIYM